MIRKVEARETKAVELLTNVGDAGV